MQYRYDKEKNPVSMLAYGCMRFTKENGKINLEKAEAEILEAMKLGVNYFDTAYIYSGSEEAMGKIFEKNHCREQIYIADKLPHYLIKSAAGLEKTFQEQLRRLRTNYIDFYLMHMLTNLETWEKLKSLGIEEWIAKKKASGEIHRIGFSYHGNTKDFCELVDAYDWDFCMIQYNYLDENSQAGRKGLQYAAAKGLPVMIMEPLRGGKLVNLLPEEAKQKVTAHPSGRSAAEWAFRWLWNQPEISVVLCGMKSMALIQENIRIADTVKVGEMTETDGAMFEDVRNAVNEKMKVPCTGCGYCQPCPYGVDIPGAFRCYNVRYTDNFFTGMREYLMCTTFRAERTNASLCRQCGKCEQHCPQGIAVRKELKQVVRHMENPVYKVIAFFAKDMFKK